MLQALLPPKYGGLGGGSYYISTQKGLSESRFDELKEYFTAKYSTDLNEEFINKNITTAHLTDKDKDELKIYLNDLQKKLENKENIKLLVIDSITAVCYTFVGEGNKIDRLERAQFLLNLVNTLKKIAYQHNLAVIVVNNTVGEVEQTSSSANSMGNIPALGILWSNSINQRLFLSKRGLNRGDKGPKRVMDISFSPSVPHATLEFGITKGGLVAIGSEEEHKS